MGKRARSRGIPNLQVRREKTQEERRRSLATVVAQRVWMLAYEMQADEPPVETGEEAQALALRSYAIAAAETAAPLAGIAGELTTTDDQAANEETMARLVEYYASIFLSASRNFDPEHFGRWREVADDEAATAARSAEEGGRGPSGSGPDPVEGPPPRDDAGGGAGSS